MPYFQSLLVLEPIEYHHVIIIIINNKNIYIALILFSAKRLSKFPLFYRYLLVCSTTCTSISFCEAGDGSDSTQTFFLHSFLAGNLIIGSGEELTINTTVPSIVNNNCSSCNYNASHEKRFSSHGKHLAAVIRFSGNIEFRNGSTVQVFGKYGLSITSQNGHILIETDINMTCTEKVLNETCLGGFTQSSVALRDLSNPPKLLYKGKRRCLSLPFSHLRLVGSYLHTYFLGGGYKV